MVTYVLEYRNLYGLTYHKAWEIYEHVAMLSEDGKEGVGRRLHSSHKTLEEALSTMSTLSGNPVQIAISTSAGFNL